MNVTGTLILAILSTIGILAYAPGASKCAEMSANEQKAVTTDSQIQNSPEPFKMLVL